MKSFIAVLLGLIVALIVIGGAVAYSFMYMGADAENTDSDSLGKIKDEASKVASSQSSDSGSGDIVGEVVKSNGQNGEGYYREVTYSDGGFRQYDTDTGELIGSSYSSDQASLPSME